MPADTIVRLVIEAVNKFSGPRDNIEMVGILDAGGRGKDVMGVHNDTSAKPPTVLVSLGRFFSQL